MRFLANENFPGAAVQALRQAGHDVAWVRTLAPGLPDPDVLALAVGEDRILLTFDKDFGELAFRQGMTTTIGIVLFRITPSSAAHVAAVAVRLLNSRSDGTGHFSVIEELRVRMTPLPTRPMNGPLP